MRRNLLYTGVTRGKRLVVLVGQKKAVAIAVRNASGRRRGRSWRSGCVLAHPSHGELARRAEPWWLGLSQDPRVQGWLDGVEPAWTLLTFESLQALRHEPSAIRTAIRIANDLSVDEIAGSPIARNTLILLQQAIERGGLPLNRNRQPVEGGGGRDVQAH